MSFAMIVIAGWLLSASIGQACECKRPAINETTHKGGNEVVTFMEREPYRKLRGVVRDVNDQPVCDVLVEVFDKPDWIARGYSRPPFDQKRLAVCKTGDDGSFCIDSISAGKYELRASKDTAWNPSHVYVIVGPRNQNSRTKRLVITLTVGT